MGDQKVDLMSSQSPKYLQRFVRQLLNDVEAFEYMLENNWFEDDTIRIGAEQEMCLINRYYKPSYKAMDILDEFHPEWLTTELAQFNLEMNLSPREFKGSAFSDMEAELRGYLNELEAVANRHESRILLTGILPSIRKFDVNIDKLTPMDRYFALMTALKNTRGSDYS